MHGRDRCDTAEFHRDQTINRNLSPHRNAQFGGEVCLRCNPNLVITKCVYCRLCVLQNEAKSWVKSGGNPA